MAFRAWLVLRAIRILDGGSEMAEEVRRAVVVASHRSSPSAKVGERTPLMVGKHRRSAEELESISGRVAENAALMERFRAARGSGNEALGRDIMDEVVRYAQSLDPTINYSDGTRIVVILMKIMEARP